MVSPASGQSIVGFAPGSGSWFEIGGATYSTQNGNDPYSVSLDQGAFRFEVRPDDHWATDSASSERSEIRGETVYAPGEILSVSYGFMVEPGAANTATGRGGDGSWLILGQFHADDWESQSPFAIEMLKERMAIVVRYGDPEHHQYRELYVDTADLQRGRYYEIDIEVRFQNDSTGFLNVWRDGEQIVSYSGPIGYDNGVYWKYGIYRSETDSTIAVDYRDMALAKGAGGVVILGTPASDTITDSISPAGQPTVTDDGDRIVGGGGADIAHAGNGNDMVIGSKGNDTLDSGAGNDIVKGGAGNDTIFGFSGTNKLMGGNGRDILQAGKGSDLLIGGKGKDLFIFAGDFGDARIKGFNPREDTIRFDKALFADYAAVQEAMSTVRGGVLIDAGDGSVLVEKARIDKLGADAFLFA
jgi:Ca2+-binding RTX toxin-like protein